MRSTYTHAQRAGIPNTRVTTPHDHELRFSYCSECPKRTFQDARCMFAFGSKGDSLARHNNTRVPSSHSLRLPSPEEVLEFCRSLLARNS
jgi:hypothetical protein